MAERKFPNGKRPPCFRCKLTKSDSLYFWQKIGRAIRYFCLGCLGHVTEDGWIL